MTINAFCRLFPFIALLLGLNYEKSLGHLVCAPPCCSSSCSGSRSSVSEANKFEGGKEPPSTLLAVDSGGGRGRTSPNEDEESLLAEFSSICSLDIPSTETANSLFFPRECTKYGAFEEISSESAFSMAFSCRTACSRPVQWPGDHATDHLVVLQLDLRVASLGHLEEEEETDIGQVKEKRQVLESPKEHKSAISSAIESQSGDKEARTFPLANEKGDQKSEGDSVLPDGLFSLHSDKAESTCSHCLSLELTTDFLYSVHLDSRQIAAGNLFDLLIDTGLQVEQGTSKDGQEVELAVKKGYLWMRIESKWSRVDISNVRLLTRRKVERPSIQLTKAEAESTETRKINHPEVRTGKFDRVIEKWPFAIVYYAFVYVPLFFYITWLIKVYREEEENASEDEGDEESEAESHGDEIQENSDLVTLSDKDAHERKCQ